jgi:hypothetical protein
MKLGQLVDYAALVGLADISVDGQFGEVPTVLRIAQCQVGSTMERDTG